MRRFVFVAGAPPADQRIVGLTGFWRMAGEVHITTIGVRQAYQRQGIGELLLIRTIDLALMRHAEAMTLEVRLSNSAAQALYEKYGFVKKGVRKGYYTNDREDAVIMTTDRLNSDSFQSQFRQLKRAHAKKMGGSHETDRSNPWLIS
jgi:ribosomal-protein-alanine N-acetyltransferase